jgi:predicted glutamine amidotransferase
LKPGSAIAASRLEAFADALLHGIDERGGDATGYVARADSGEVRLQRASCSARTFVNERRPFPEGTRTVLLHTRFATQGDAAFPENNHPVYSGDVYCVHNGHVSNDRELFGLTSAERMGQVDSEAIPALVAELGFQNAADAMALIEGAAAVAMLNAATGDVVLARAYASPLVVISTPSMVAWASTHYALERAWKETLGTPPGKGQFVSLKEGTLVRFGPSGSSTETFLPYAPPAPKEYATWWKPKRGALKLIPGTWSESEREDDRDYFGERLPVRAALERCDVCSDWFPRSEMYEVWDGFPVCAGCEAYLMPLGGQDEEVRA